MAKIYLRLSVVRPAAFERMLESLSEAVHHAHRDVSELEIASGNGLTFRGVHIARMPLEKGPNGFQIRMVPGIGLPLFAAAVMEILPERASLAWDDGWPIFHCSPRDDGDVEDDPTPLVPDELVLA